MITEVIVESPTEVIVQIVEANPLIEVFSQGIQGPRGYAVFSGSGSPSPSEGINLDLYIDLDKGWLYKKIGGVWVFQIAISPQKEEFDIQAPILAAQKVTLAIAPNPNLVSISFIGGIEQANDGTAFYISGNEIKWDGISPVSGLPYDFQTLLAVDDIMIVRY